MAVDELHTVFGTDSESDEGNVGAKRILFLRHGQSVANQSHADTVDELDCHLTPLGRQQASAWRETPLDVEAVLCSPLRRAMETAARVFQDHLPIDVCRYARERWWHMWQCRGCPHADLVSFAACLPREIGGIHELERTDKFWDPEHEAGRPPAELDSTSDDGLKLLVQTLANHPAQAIAVVCHYGVIEHVAGVEAGNCDIVECELADGALRVVGHRQCLLRPKPRPAHPLAAAVKLRASDL